MIYNCTSCGILWTNKQTTTKVVVKRVPRQTCVDCATFDYPKYTQSKLAADRWFAKPEKKERAAK